MTDNGLWFDNDGLTKKLFVKLESYKNEVKSIDEDKGIFNSAAPSTKTNLGEIDDAYRNEITKILKDTVSSLQKTAAETNKYIMTIYRTSVALNAVKYNNGLMRFIPQYQAQAMAYSLLNTAYSKFVEKNNESLKRLGPKFVSKNKEIEEAHNEFISKLRIL